MSYDPYHDVPRTPWGKPFISASTSPFFWFGLGRSVKVKRGRGGRRKRRARNAIYRASYRVKLLAKVA